MVVVRGRLTPEVGAVLRRALEAACDQARRAPASDGGAKEDAADASAGAEDEAAGAPAGAPADVEEPTLAQRQADAIGTLAEAALAGGLDRGTAGDRYQVVLHVDAEALGERRDVPARTSGGAASGPAPRADGDRVPAECAASGPAPGADGDRVPAECAASGPAPRADGDRVPAECAASGPAPGADGGRVPAGTSGGAASGSAPGADGGRVPAGTPGGVASGPVPRGDRVPAGTPGGVASGPVPRGDRVPAGTPAAHGPGDGSPMRTETPSRAGRARHSRRRRMSGPCPGVWPATPASDTATSEPTTAASEPSAARARRSSPARCARRPPTSASTPSAAPAAGRQTVLDEAGGIHVSAETARRMACDAATVTMRHGPGGEILDVGRRTRTISPALRRALAARDRQCRFRVAATFAAMRTTFGTGPTAAGPRSTTWCCCAGCQDNPVSLSYKMT